MVAPTGGHYHSNSTWTTQIYQYMLFVLKYLENGTVPVKNEVIIYISINIYISDQNICVLPRFKKFSSLQSKIKSKISV